MLLAPKEKSNKFTIMVIPHSEDSPLVFKLPIALLQVIGVLTLAVIMFSIGFVTRYVDMSKSLDELEYLRQDNIAKNGQIEALAKETQLLIEMFQEIKELEEKLKNLTGIKDEANLGGNERTVDQYLFATNRGITTLERANRSIIHLNTSIPDQKDTMNEMVGDMEERNRRLAATPNRWPTSGIITSPFGNRRGPFIGAIEFHSGIDIANRTGTAVWATANGTVTFAGYRGGYGNLIIIDHGYGFSTYYAHLSRINVRAGQWVQRGSTIGLMGSTGNSTAPHLHYEVRVRGTPVNPRNYMN